MLSKTIVAHDVLDLLAATASVKVQDARFSIATAFLRSGAAVGIGTAATRKEAVLRPSLKAFKNRTILVKKKLWKGRMKESVIERMSSAKVLERQEIEDQEPFSYIT
jgi:hypothetical protein